MKLAIITSYCLSNADQNLARLKECITSIKRAMSYASVHTQNFTANTFVIDDYSVVPLESKCSHLQLTVLRNAATKGQGGALNFAITNVSADYYFFTDSDCMVNENWLVCHLNFLAKNKACLAVCGPNWYHQKTTSIIEGFLTRNESRLMQIVMENYLDTGSIQTKRIDCRNLVFHRDFFAQDSSKCFFYTGGDGTSSHTSYRLSETASSPKIYFNPEAIVLHDSIRSLRTQMLKYFRRGLTGNYKRIYVRTEVSLPEAFWKIYFERHFIKPLKKGVSLFYLWPVHLSFWIGILLSKNR